MRHTPLLATMALTAMGAHSLAAQTMRSVATSRPLSGERMLRASIEFGAGTVHVGPAASGDLYRMQLRYDADRNGPVNQFDAATGAVRLGLQGNGNAGIRVTSRAQMAQRAEIGFAPGVPLMLSANLGASDATLDLGGLSLTSLAVRGGASSTTVNFDTPNRATCSSATFTLGAAEFDVSGLANSGCASSSACNSRIRRSYSASGTDGSSSTKYRWLCSAISRRRALMRASGFIAA